MLDVSGTLFILYTYLHTETESIEHRKLNKLLLTIFWSFELATSQRYRMTTFADDGQVIIAPERCADLLPVNPYNDDRAPGVMLPVADSPQQTGQN